MADWPPLKNSAFTVTFPIYDADGDLVAGATSPDSEVSIDGGTFTDVSPGEAVEIATSSGVYKLALAAGEMNGDIIAVITKSGTGKTAVNVMYTVTRQLKDLAYPATSGRSLLIESDSVVHADVKEWLGVAPLALSSQRVQTEVGAMGSGVIAAATFAAGAVDAAALAADAGNEIADAVLKRDIDQVEATAPVHSLGTAVLKAVSRIVDDAGTLKLYRTDGSTLHMSQTITVNATADPIDELTVGV
jgi:hypothetical protein